MKLLYKVFFAAIALTAQIQVQAQASDLPYECGFEENEDLSAWVLNAGTQTATDQWIIGTDAHSEGKRSLYISSDGQFAQYGSNPNAVAAYLRYKFPTETTQKTYDISFDWKGGCDTTDSKLYVMVCLESELTDKTSPYYLNGIVSTTSGILSLETQHHAALLGESRTSFLCDGSRWQNVSLSNEIKINSASSSETFAIVFIWVNNNIDTTIVGSSIAIDNIQISSVTIKKPWNMTVIPQCEDSSMLVSWEGVSREFELQYRPVESSNWRRFTGIIDGTDGFTRENGTHCSFVFNHIAEGSYDVRVRGIAGEDTTSFAYAPSTLVYCPDNHCINYIDLEGTNTHCTYGYYPNGSYSPYQYVGVVDFGPDASNSRHTVHIDPTETDPRTGGLLHTVPEGAFASVRLGNWETQIGAESITYDIAVDSANSGILIIRYAVVLQDPSHNDNQPQFSIEILDSHGNLIGPACGHLQFDFDDAIASGWNVCQYGRSRGGDIATWKDWTTMGINLMDYDGETVKVRFTTMDCGWGEHFGYAYFTLDCADANMTYSKDSSGTTFFAPDGFAYEWTNEDGDILSTSRELTVDNSSNQIYTCKLSSLEDSNCYFTISVQPEDETVPNAIDNTPFSAAHSATKIINNGQLIIRRGDKTYNLQGQEIIVP